MWSGATTTNNRIRSATRPAARRFELSLRLAIAVDRDAVELHAMIDEAKAELFGDALLERFQLIVDELDHVAGLHVDQMVVMGFRRRFVAGSAVSELMALENASFLEQAHGPVDRRNGDVRINRRGPRVQRLDIRMIFAVAEHARDDLALLGDPQAFVGAQRLDVDGAAHAGKLGMAPHIVQRVTRILLAAARPLPLGAEAD